MRSAGRPGQSERKRMRPGLLPITAKTLSTVPIYGCYHPDNARQVTESFVLGFGTKYGTTSDDGDPLGASEGEPRAAELCTWYVTARAMCG